MSPFTGSPPDTPASGDVAWPTIAGYELLSEIAAGGMATVYLARSTAGAKEGGLVAIKHCHPHLRRDPDFVAMFVDEARLASLIRHPNVVMTLDVGNAESLYFVMQYVEGVSLADWLAHLSGIDARIEVPLLLRVAVDALAGLSAAHALTDAEGRSLKLVHRDVSPQNILIGVDGVAKISDFGIAKAEMRATRTRTGQVKGKTGYMSPEQILLEPLDPRSDVYALGVVLWEALVGKRLFDGDSDAATINLVLSGKIPAPSELAGTDVRLDAVVLSALSFEPKDRFANAEAMAEAIFATGIEIASPRAVGECVSTRFGAELQSRQHALAAAASRSQPSRVRRRWTRVLGLGILLLTLIFGGIAGYVYVTDDVTSPVAPTLLAPDDPHDSSIPAAAPGKDAATSSPDGAAPTPSSMGVISRPVERPRTAPTKPSSAPGAITGSATPLVPTPSTPSVAAPRNRTKPSEYRPNDL